MLLAVAVTSLVCVCSLTGGASWRTLAKDGVDIPSERATMRPAAGRRLVTVPMRVR